jgi:hypothetical protein
MDHRWFWSQVLFSSMAGIGALSGFLQLSLILVCIIFMRAGHEFTHAIFVWITGGTVEEINLCRYPTITFTGKYNTFIYLGGVIFDVVFIGGTAVLMITGGPIEYYGWLAPYIQKFFIAVGIALLGILIYQMVIPEKSDFNMIFGVKE